MARYYVLGKEVFNMAQVYGIHQNKEIAQKQVNTLEKSKHNLHCQTFTVMNQTEVNNSKVELYR